MPSVNKPTVYTSYSFSATYLSPSINPSSSPGWTASGDLRAYYPGTYTVTFNLNSGYTWSDGSTDAYSVQWYINKRSLVIPFISPTTFVYDGNPHIPTSYNVDTTYVQEYPGLPLTNVGSSIDLFRFRNSIIRQSLMLTLSYRSPTQ